MLRTSDGIIGRVSIGLRVLQCVHTAMASICVSLRFVVVSRSQSVHLLDVHVYVMRILSNVRVSSMHDSNHEQLVLVALRH